MLCISKLIWHCRVINISRTLKVLILSAELLQYVDIAYSAGLSAQLNKEECTL